MQKYINNVQDTNGNAIGSVTVTIRDNPGGGVSTIFSDNAGTAKTNPFTNDPDGEFFFFAADGRYDIELTGPITETNDDIRLLDILTTGNTLRINTDINTATPPTTEAITGLYEIFDLANDDLLAQFGFQGSAVLIIQSRMHGGPIRLQGEDSGGIGRTIFEGDPDLNSQLFRAGIKKLRTGSSGVAIFADIVTATPPTTEPVQAQMQFVDSDDSDILGFVGFDGTNFIRLLNRMHGGGVTISAEDSAGVLRTLFTGDPDGVTTLKADTDLRLEVNAGELALEGVANFETRLFYNNEQKLKTVNEAGSDTTSGVHVVNAAGVMKPVGLGVIIDDATAFGSGTQTPFQQINAHETILHDESSATNFDTFPSTGASQTFIPAGAQWEVKNTGTGALTIRPGTSVTLTWFDGGGAAPPTGNRTLARSGRCVVRKINDTNYEIWGVGLT